MKSEKVRGIEYILMMAVIAAAGAAAGAAFDSDAWMEKRRLLNEEALRLKAAYTNCVAHLETPAEDVTVPIETHPDGSVKTVVSAKKAQFFLDSGFVWAEGVVVRKFKKDGSLDVRIDAENCAIDRWSKSGWAEGRAKVVQGDTTFTGRNVYFSSPESYVKVYQDADLDSKNLKVGGLRP